MLAAFALRQLSKSLSQKELNARYNTKNTSLMKGIFFFVLYHKQRVLVCYVFIYLRIVHFVTTD